MNEPLLDLLAERGPALSQRVLADMYEDPFWTERYGDRGRRHADEDSDFHLRYLRRALVAGDPGILSRYARWLREVLATRGMCSRHLGENFARLARAIGEQQWPGGERAVEYLRGAEASLQYPGGVARALQVGAEALAVEIADAFAKEHPQAPRRLVRNAPYFEDDLANLVSYLADSLGLGGTATLVAHVAWLQGSLERHGLPGDHLDDVLAVLEQVLRKRVETSEAVIYLDAARASLAEAQGQVS